MTVAYESLPHAYDLESARSRSVCLGKWKRSRVYFSSLKWGKLLTFLFRHPPPLPVPFTLMDEAVSPPPSRKRPRPTYFEFVPSVVALLCYQLLLLGSQITRTRSVMVADVPVKYPEQGRTSPHLKLIQTTMKCQNPKLGSRARGRSEDRAQPESHPVNLERRKAWTRAHISQLPASSSRSSSSPSNTTRRSGSSMSSHPPMGVGHLGAAHGKQ